MKLGIHGLLPPLVVDQKTEVDRVLANLRRIKDGLDQYVYLMHLLDRLFNFIILFWLICKIYNFVYYRDERLFYQTLESNVEEVMPLVYTPTVGAACINYGFIFTESKYIIFN